MSGVSLVGQKVLVTGAAGFIGSHLVDALLENGAEVMGVDNHISSAPGENLQAAKRNSRFRFIEADVLTAPEDYLPAEVKFDLVLHFASPASPPIYQKYPVETYLVNSYGTHLLLTWLKKTNPRGTFLFAGTSEAYGTPLVHPQTEDYWGNVNPNGLRSCYDEAKRLGETICGVFARDFGFDTRIVRIFNTYGPRMNLNDGRILPQFIKEYLANEPLSIYGDGLQTRSYCEVSDLVRGVLLFANLPAENLKGQTINLGNPGEFTVLQTAELFNQITGRSADNLTFHPLPQDDPTRRQPDITKATELLGWKPEIAFADGLKNMIDFYHPIV